MAEATSIEWCDSTFNPWIGCTKVSTADSGGGCDHCYAEVSTPARVLRGKGQETWGPGAPRQRTSAEYWKQPIRWNDQPFVECMACHWRGEPRTAELIENPSGFFPPLPNAYVCPTCSQPLLKKARRRVFCASLADVFDNEVDPAWRADLFALIAATPNLDWLLLTKRIGNARTMIDEALGEIWRRDHFKPLQPAQIWPWPNVWLMATMVNQAEYDRDIGKLLRTPAAARGISIEPMLGPIDLRLGGASLSDYSAHHPLAALDWTITGGESCPNARPANPQWFRDIRDQCAAAGVFHLHKQNGEFASVSEVAGPGAHHTFEDGRTVRHVGKKLAGRTLDGQVHNGFPEVRRG